MNHKQIRQSFLDFFQSKGHTDVVPAIAWAWELLTEKWGLSKEKLYATVYCLRGQQIGFIGRHIRAYLQLYSFCYGLLSTRQALGHDQNRRLLNKNRRNHKPSDRIIRKPASVTMITYWLSKKRYSFFS